MQHVRVTTPKGDSVLTEEGAPVVSLLDAKNAVRALELLGKHLGMFVNKTELTGPDGAPLDMGPIEVAFITPDEKNE